VMATAAAALRVAVPIVRRSPGGRKGRVEGGPSPG
jgi:hypothetical protein